MVMPEQSNVLKFERHRPPEPEADPQSQEDLFIVLWSLSATPNPEQSDKTFKVMFHADPDAPGDGLVEYQQRTREAATLDCKIFTETVTHITLLRSGSAITSEVMTVITVGSRRHLRRSFKGDSREQELLHLPSEVHKGPLTQNVCDTHLARAEKEANRRAHARRLCFRLADTAMYATENLPD